MIAGDTKWLEEYKAQLPERIYACLEAVRSFDFAHKEDGKYEVPGGVMSLESPVTEPKALRKLEGHKKFIDVVYLVAGEEWIGVRPHHEAEGETESHPDRDLYFFKSSGEESQVHMRPGYFLICWPEDLHRPLCMVGKEPETLRKVVVKVPVESV